MSAAIQVVKDTATPALADLVARIRPARLGAVLGRAGANLIKRHLESLPANKRGWPTTNFWKDASRSTSSAPDPTGATITINKLGFRQRLAGGLIKPVNAKALAIPISPVSYGHLPSDFPGLFLLKTPKGAYLVQRDGAPEGKELKADRVKRRKGMGGNFKRRQQGKLNFLFKLSGGVNQRGNPAVLPSDAQFEAELTAELAAALPPA